MLSHYYRRSWKMINLTRGDAAWLLKLLIVAEGAHEDYQELFSSEEEETILIAGELIRGIT